MTTKKFNNETITLEIKNKGYGQYSLVIETEKWILSKYTTNSVLVDSINSNEDEENDYGTVQDAIDTAVEMVLDANSIEYTLSN